MFVYSDEVCLGLKWRFGLDFVFGFGLFCFGIFM